MKDWVLDATLSSPKGWCYVPVEGDIGSGNETFVTGLNSIHPPNVKPDHPVLGVIHEDGQQAVEAWLKGTWPSWPEWAAS